LLAAVTDETGTGSLVFATSPTFVTPALGTPSSGTVTNLTGTASININGTVGATTANTGAFTTLSASGTTTLNGNQIISVTDDTNAALRITQLGTGNALLVEDSSNPDSTPFVIDASGRVGIGTTSLTGVSLGINKSITGATTSSGVYVNSTIQSDVTSNGIGFRTSLLTQATAFTLTNLYHYLAAQSTIGAGSTVTNQYGFYVDNGLVGATNNYGFHSNIASATNRWNFYAAGTADNYFAGKTRIGTSATSTVSFEIGATDAMLLPKGTTAQQPTGVAGYLRFNTSTTQFEGYNGTAWSSVGGAAISNDTSTSTNVYPLFANATSGTALTVYTGNAKLLYKPSTGELQSSVPVALNGLVVNSQTVSASYTIAAGYSAMSSGPVTVASGQAVTVSSGSRWVII
jgi:hypothetical protein